MDEANGIGKMTVVLDCHDYRSAATLAFAPFPSCLHVLALGVLSALYSPLLANLLRLRRVLTPSETPALATRRH